ncbi:hypothetical protein [Gulosibacter sp. 10]|uniref:hypothetical protein n=1 Tax=Gulosibacter sp. 10 TaxID=1255570 RepID=UPI00097F6380|nr:hypothetical protein [Gulosibacter sp. 10]SJM50641.1 hypothetical protein FM112_01520 [Gulosibacter sp. 10]
MTAGAGTWITRITATIGAALLLVGGGLVVADSAQAAQETVDGVDFAWTINDEVGGGAYFGGCNFLVAGPAGDAGSSRLWQEGDGFYETQAGNVTITKPDSSGDQVQPTWSTKCQNAAGSPVNTSAGSTTDNQVNLANGSGTVDPEADHASIGWDGTFTIVFYGGMTYWSVKDVQLEVKDGKGALTGTAFGFGADMFDPTKWVELPETKIDLATFSGVDVTQSGIVVQPDYLGVEIDIEPDGPSNPQIRSGDTWGSFPQSFVDFNVLTGQAAYWYSSGGAADPKKPAEPFEVSYELSTEPIADPAYDKVPEGYDEGLGIDFRRLTEDGGTVAACLEGEPLPLQEGTSEPTIANGGASGTWDVSGLQRRAEPYRLQFFLDDCAQGQALDGGSAGALEAALFVVEPLGDTTAAISVDGVTHSSAVATWSWPKAEPNTPEEYEFALYQGSSASGDPVQTDSVTGTEMRIGTLQPETAYTVAVTPKLATTTGATSTQTFTTSAAPSSTPPPGGGGGGNNNGGGGGDDGSADGVTLYWGLSMEATGGAYFGVCNFLAAGVAADTGSSRLWTADDFSAASGNVTIVKPDASGQFQPITWDTKCLDRNGSTVSVTGKDSYTESQVRLTEGEVVKNDSSGVRVEWEGGFSVVFYGGLTYWSASDLVLELDANGNGKLTATGSGYGASMHDASVWEPLDARTITLADLSGVDLASIDSNGGFVHTPDYLGVEYTGTGESQGVPGGGGETATGQAPRSAENQDHWGSFPSDFVDFQNETGQFSYWFTSGGARDPYKPALPMTVSFADSFAPTAGGYDGQGTPTLNQQQSPQQNPLNANAAPGDAPEAANGGDALAAQGEALLEEAAGLAADTEFSFEITPAMLISGGSALLGVAGLNWAGALFMRRRLGLDPSAYV